MGKKSKYLEIADLILGDIQRGKYPTGRAIPPIRGLAKAHGVNPQTVSKATSHLVALGYLEARQGSGCVVKDPGAGKGGSLFIPMLVDRERSSIIEEPDSTKTFHSKDVYLSYLMNMNRLGHQARFYTYDRDSQSVSEELLRDEETMDGVIVQGSLPRSYFTFFSERNIPVVLINRKPAESLKGRFASVMIDVSNISQMADYLISLGHGKILFCQSNEYREDCVFDRRMKAASKPFVQWKPELDVELKPFRFTADDKLSIDEMASYLKEGFSAAMCFNDFSALALYRVLHVLEKDVPFDFSVVGFDDMLAGQLASPPLTTIRVNLPALVTEAISLLDTLRKQESPAYLEKSLPTEIVFRKSTFAKR